ncbi:1,4-dihydroxy-2-naphthoate polyprenyltransferase [Urechidicola croceus]|uniref:1,4-dihydroxy-2-naphthoate octaprenyltransferase n=1 Tax=Urechidicola croceus TaxID=1850246 RepID=A0A1D8P6Q1_9FLAO|nr:1,4-dihydroxy-2-naphthoate polyprenyltransferase [Urechidicola croceus]AOW20243.1 1,4-dihydroxy-2-naphthoate octaprenyltransferase [Urechidicola croceus]
MIKHYIQAARLRTLPLSISGIIVGSTLAHSQGLFDWKIFFLAILTTIGFQVLSNFANDYGDGVKGTDNEDRIGPKRALQSGVISPKQMLNAMKITGVITLIIALLLIYFSFGKENFGYSVLFFFLGISSIVAAIKYTVGKNAYGYSGLGDVFVFLFFGLLSVCGSYFLFTKQLNFTIFLPAASIGLLSAGVLNLNNMRDRESDAKVGKNTLVVKIGDEFAKYYHYYLIISAFLLALLYVMIHYKSYIQFLFLIAFIPIFKHLYVVSKNMNPKKLDPELKKLALSTFLFAILLGLGTILA